MLAKKKKPRSRKLEYKWTVDDVLLLIDAVKEAPILWAIHRREHLRKRHQWESISQNSFQSRISAQELQQKWQNMRCQFFDYAYKIKNKLITEVKWMYFTKLSFLAEKRRIAKLSSELGQLFASPLETLHMEDQSNASNLSAITVSNSNDSATTNLPYNDLIISDVTSLASNTSSVSTQTDEIPYSLSCNNQILSDAFKLIPTRPCDESQIFGDYVALQMRRISLDKRLALEVKIQKLIMENI